MKYFAVFLVISALITSGCSSDSDNSGDNNSNSDNLRSASLSDLIGTIAFEDEKSYQVTRSDSTVSIYSLQPSNCYDKNDYTITSIGDGFFSYSSDNNSFTEFTTVIGDLFNFYDSPDALENDDGYEGQKVSLAESDITPLCSGTTDGGTSTDGGSGGTNQDYGDLATLADLVGVIDFTKVITNDMGVDETDEYYTVIRSDGAASDYDYFGDTFDQGENCYDKFDFTLQDLGNGNFISDGDQFSPFKFFIDGDTITIEFVANGQTFTSIGTKRSDLVEAGFAPICEFDNEVTFSLAKGISKKKSKRPFKK